MYVYNFTDRNIVDGSMGPKREKLNVIIDIVNEL